MKTSVLLALLASCLTLSASMPTPKHFEADPLLHIGGSEESSYSPVKEKRIDSMAGPMLQIDSKQGEINSYSERANPFSADSLLQIGSEKESSYAD